MGSGTAFEVNVVVEFAGILLEMMSFYTILRGVILGWPVFMMGDEVEQYQHSSQCPGTCCISLNS
jgi:hypothetical protein